MTSGDSRAGALAARVHDRFRTELWPLPAAGVAAAILLGVLLPRAETSIPWLAQDSVQRYLFGGGPDAARTVLSSIAGSMITVTALTFSLTVVTLQLASSQFSPRLLRTFTRDLVVQSILALFLGTFTYALTVLRTVRTESSAHAEFVPDISVTVAYLLAVSSVVGLTLFLAHLAQTIRVESMLRSVHQDAQTTARRELFDDRGAPPAWDSLRPARPATVITAPASGFLVQIREDELLEAAVRAGLLLVLDARPGDSIVAATPVGAVWALDDDQGPVDPDAIQCLLVNLVTGFERTSLQDVALGLRQLTDVAVKALSPGINDPTTAVHALGHSAALLCELTQRDLGPRMLRDDLGRLRVVLARPDLASLLRLALDQPARYGAAEPDVLERLMRLLREVAWVCAPHQHRDVEDALARLLTVLERADLAPKDRARLVEAAVPVREALAGRWDGHAQT